MKIFKNTFKVVLCFYLPLFLVIVWWEHPIKNISFAKTNFSYNFSKEKPRPHNPQLVIPCSFEETQNRLFFSVGIYPCGIAFDGANIWVADYGSGNVTKLRTSDGAVLGTYSVGMYPIGVTFDGANIWVTNSGSNTVTELQASDGEILGTYAIGFNPRGVVSDGTNIWVANYDSNCVAKQSIQ